jgi:hypothetical protein
MELDFLRQADSLQVHWLVFEVLLFITFLIHVILMNLMLGGSILNMVAAWRKLKVGDASHQLPSTIALAVNFGVPPLLFVQVLYGKLFYTSSILMGKFWLAVIPMLILAYYAAYIAAYSRHKLRHAVCSTVSALLLLTIGFFYTNNMTLMLRPDEWSAYFLHPGGTLLNLAEPTLFPRYLHMVIGALAVASLGWAVWGHFAQRQGSERGEPAKRQGLKLFFYFTCAQMILGFTWLLLLPQPVQQLFLGRHLLATALLLIGVLLALGLLIMAWRGSLWGTLSSLMLTLGVMLGLRDIVRAGYLNGTFHPSQLTVAPALSPFMLFLISFIIGLGLLAWMLKLALDPTYRAKPEEQA